MDELNVQQCWGISPFIDLLHAASTAGAALQHDQQQGGDQNEQQQLAFLQVCPYDCRHSLATISNKARCAAAAKAASSSHQPQPQQQQQLQQKQLQIYVFETEPEALARHMLLLMVLFDDSLTARERAEMFLELHGNVLLRQRTADWACAASKQLEAAVAGPANHQQQQRSPAETVLDMFDLSMLKYKEKDVLLETFQHCRVKSGFDVAGAWQGRCRKWYGDRYDFRHNMIDWDYHMRLSLRGTPFLDPALGSIIHFYHFRHWRLAGVAYELRESSYTATNTSMLSTAYGRTREYKDRYLRDVGRSVAAYGFWGDVLNPPYHAFGTVSDAPALLQQVNKQFSHTSVDAAEHNVLGFIQRLCGPAAAAAAAAAGSSAGASHCDCEAQCSSHTQAHRARAARGPTSLENLSAAQQQAMAGGCQQQQQQQQDEEAAAGQVQEQGEAGIASSTPAVLAKGGSADGAGSIGSSTEAEPEPDAAGAVDQSTEKFQSMSMQQQGEPSMGVPHHQQQQQQPEAAETAAQQQAATEPAQMAAGVQSLLRSVKILLLTGDLRRVLTGKAGFAGRFSAATVGHRHVHLLGPEAGLADVLRPGAPVFVETAANMVQLNNEQVAAFEGRLLELAAAAGFRPHAAFASHPQQQQHGSSEQGAQKAGGEGEKGGAPLLPSQTTDSSSWQLPAGHLALCVCSSEECC